MSKSHISLLIAIIITAAGFVAVDYNLLQSQGLQEAVIGNAINIPAVLQIESATATPSTTATPASSSFQTRIPSPTPQVCTMKEYRFLENADPCKIASYVKKGWDVSQLGAVIELNGQQADCATFSSLSIDTAVLVHEVPRACN